MTNSQIKMLERKNSRSLNYYTQKLIAGKLNRENYEEKIRPITYAKKWLETLIKIEGLISSVKSLKNNAVSFYKLGTSDNFMIKQTNGKIDSKYDHTKLYDHVKSLYKENYYSLKKGIKEVHTNDLLDEIMDDQNQGEVDYE